MPQTNSPDAMENSIMHFAVKVPLQTAFRIRDIAKAVKSDFISACGRGEAYGDGVLERVHGYPISGFHPNQLGGYEVTEMYTSEVDKRTHFTKLQTEFIEVKQKELHKTFAEAYNMELGTTILSDNWVVDDLPPALYDDFFEYENSWYDPALLRFQIWVDDSNLIGGFDLNKKKPNTVFMKLSLSYKDSPYYRSDKIDEVLYKKAFNVTEIMAHSATHWLDELRKAIFDGG